jgi:hypothetical protein
LIDFEVHHQTAFQMLVKIDFGRQTATRQMMRRKPVMPTLQMLA